LISIDELPGAIEKELTLYNESVIKGINKAGKDAIEKLVEKTKEAAPKKSGRFSLNIMSKIKTGTFGNAYIWCVGAPDYRLTHLLVHGHAKRNGGRTKANPFLQNAVDEVLPEYETNVKEEIENAGH